VANGTLPTTIRPEVQQYLKACESLIGGIEGAREQFMEASTALQLKSGLYTDEELHLVRSMLCRVSDSLVNDYRKYP